MQMQGQQLRGGRLLECYMLGALPVFSLSWPWRLVLPAGGTTQGGGEDTGCEWDADRIFCSPSDGVPIPSLFFLIVTWNPAFSAAALRGDRTVLFLSSRCVPSLCSFQYPLPYWKTLLGHCSKCHLDPAFLHPSCLRVLYFVWEARRERPRTQVFGNMQRVRAFQHFSSYLLSTNLMLCSGTQKYKTVRVLLSQSR